MAPYVGAYKLVVAPVPFRPCSAMLLILDIAVREKPYILHLSRYAVMHYGNVAKFERAC